MPKSDRTAATEQQRGISTPRVNQQRSSNDIGQGGRRTEETAAQTWSWGSAAKRSLLAAGDLERLRFLYAVVGSFLQEASMPVPQRSYYTAQSKG